MRGMVAGIVAAGVWAAAEPALGRVFGIPWYSDRRLLGGLARVGPEAAIAIHLVNGALFGATFERLGLRGPASGVVMAQAESIVALAGDGRRRPRARRPAQRRLAAAPAKRTRLRLRGRPHMRSSVPCSAVSSARRPRAPPPPRRGSGSAALSSPSTSSSIGAERPDSVCSSGSDGNSVVLRSSDVIIGNPPELARFGAQAACSHARAGETLGRSG